MACFSLHDDGILHGMMIIKNEDILFIICLACFLSVFIELSEYLGDIFYFFINVDDLIGEYGVLVFEPFYLVGVELLCLFELASKENDLLFYQFGTF